MSTVEVLAATSVASSLTWRMAGLRLTRSPRRQRSDSSWRSASTSLKSRNVSAPPMTLPAALRRTAVDTLTGIFRPFRSMMNAGRLIRGRPDSSVRRSAQAASHMLDLNTSGQGRPIASLRSMPVMASAARLNEVTRHSRSTVKTPSEMLSRIASVDAAAEFSAGMCSVIFPCGS
ncbi:hypothetical protein SDC9_160469 [bioreactor metagenome]|uniref:Uncharacterized protein n=1 Tax=bioreactor metagenome TaxID=1076179 RepID=A0A645FIH4_9ZZZZ